MEGPGLRGKETEVVGAELGRGRLVQPSPAIGCHGPETRLFDYLGDNEQTACLGGGIAQSFVMRQRARHDIRPHHID